MAADSPSVYRPRHPEQTVLSKVVRDHLRTFQAITEESGRPLPRYVWRELERLVGCGCFARGFVRVRCPTCGFDRLVAFACKGRSICPTCVGRTMNDTAAFWTDHVIRDVPVRHWVCTLPVPLRYLVAHDPALCSQVLGFFVRAVFRRLKHKAKLELGLDSVRQAHPAAVTVVQRASSHLALNVHFHSLAADGVYVQRSADEAPTFRALPEPNRGEVMSVAWETCTNTLALLRRRGMWMEADPNDDRFAQEQPGLAQCCATSLAGVLMVGPRAGERVLRIGACVGGSENEEPLVAQGVTPGYGFSVHAARRVPANAPKDLERLARYALRPAIAQHRLKLSADGKVIWELKRAWSDGTSHFVFEPVDFIGKLAALVFPPRMHRIRYAGVWARRSKLRERVRPKVEALTASDSAGCRQSEVAEAHRPRRPRYDWAQLLARVFAVDVLECPKCHSKEMQLVAVITRGEAIRRILSSVGMPADSPSLAPAHSPTQGDLFDAA